MCEVAYSGPGVERRTWAPAVYGQTDELTQENDLWVVVATRLVNRAYYILNSRKSRLRTRPDILIATLGRLYDHLRESPTFALDALCLLVRRRTQGDHLRLSDGTSNRAFLSNYDR